MERREENTGMKRIKERKKGGRTKYRYNKNKGKRRTKAEDRRK
jgi:hypothetical protein